MKKNELNIAGECFGFNIEERTGIGPLVKVYLEDDENYNYQFSMDAYWLDELIELLTKINRAYKAGPTAVRRLWKK